MRSPDEIYWGYVAWALKIGVPPMSREGYEKAIGNISSNPTNVEAILRNNHKNDRDK